MFLSKEEWKKKVKKEDKDYVKRKAKEWMNDYLNRLIREISRCYGNESNQNELWLLQHEIREGVKKHSSLRREQIFFCEKLLNDAFYEHGIVI